MLCRRESIGTEGSELTHLQLARHSSRFRIFDIRDRNPKDQARGLDEAYGNEREEVHRGRDIRGSRPRTRPISFPPPLLPPLKCLLDT